MLLRSGRPTGSRPCSSWACTSGPMKAWVLSSEHSVRPYALTIAACGWRAYQRVHSSGGSTSPLTMNQRSSGRAGGSTPVSHRSTAARTKEGTVSRTVIPRRAASSKRAAGSRAVSRVTRWTCPPVISGASICHTEMSKVSGAFITTRSPSPSPRSSALARRWLFMPRRWTMAPLGLPVEPEVKQT